MNEHWNDNGFALSGADQYEALIAAIPGGIVITAVDDDFTLLFANQGYYDLVGYTREEHVRIFGNVGIATLHPDEAQTAAADARAQLQQAGAFRVKAKLCHKTKGYIWVHFSGRLRATPDGNAQIYIVIVDISEQQIALEKLEQERSFNELIAALSEEYFFECDLLTRTMRYSKSFTDKLGLDATPTDYLVAFQQLGLLTEAFAHKPEADFFASLALDPERELRFLLPDGEELWYLCRCTVLFDPAGTAVRVVGKLIDITRHKLQIDELSHLAQRDQLTGLYNKISTESRIKEMLKMRRLHDDNCALMIIDIDNFKNVNDRLGHLYGDAVLTQLAEHLKALFRSDDIVGRVGGDEFFVFLKSYRSIKVLRSKAAEICTLFHKTYSEGDAFVTISASIGIALCPEQGTDFDVLYRKADSALYAVKAAGKNSFSFYEAESAQCYTSARTEIDSNTLKKSFKDNRIEYVFRLLYGSENSASSIQAVLQLVTESYGFSRGYIFETSPDGKTTNNTFEWCAKGISAEIQNLQSVPIEAVATANRSFCEMGMFILKRVSDLPPIERDVLEPQGIRSMFQFGIMDMGKLVGFIGFDDCTSERIPSDTEIDEICTVCHVLAMFLLKHRSYEREIRHHESVETIMNHISSYTYVIDTDDYSVLYENELLARAIGHPSVGQKCHTAYRNSKTPCPDCPAAQLGPQTDRHAVEFFNKEFDIYVRSEATRINWAEDKTAYLLCGIDISEYKRK